MEPTLGSLADGRVHVWHAALEGAGPSLERAAACLSDEERERAARFRFERDRRRFVLSCAFLRGLLSHYLDCSPREVAMRREPGGKPRLERAPEPLRFNLSHSGELAVAAVAHGGEVGVDVETLGKSRRLDLLERRVLSAGEREQLRTIAEDAARQLAFLRAWTRKEAVLKAIGSGIDRDLTTIDVGVGGGASADGAGAGEEGGEGLDPRVVTLADQGGIPSQWSVASFVVAPGYASAVAASGPELHLARRAYEL